MAAMATASLPHCASPIGYVTVSLGVAPFDPDGSQGGAKETLERADAALYRAKHAGRNGFQVAKGVAELGRTSQIGVE